MGVTELLDLTERDRLAALARLAILGTPPEERFDFITELARRLFGVPIALVTLLDADRLYVKSQDGDVVLPSVMRRESFCDVTIQTPDVFVVPDATQDDRFQDSPMVGADPSLRFYAGHAIAAPGGHNVGALCLLDHEPREFSAADQRLLAHLARWVSREMALVSEMDHARGVQTRLLPTRVPDLTGYELAAACLTSSAVGGDFYDWGPTAEGLSLTVADVMGKGMGAALMAATVRATMRAASRLSPAETVARAAHLLADDLEETRTFVTLFHARLRAGDGRVAYSDAGQGLTIVGRADGSTEVLQGSDIPVGVLPGTRWMEHHVRLDPGDLLVAFTDGVLDIFDGTEASLLQAGAVVRGCSSAQEVVDRFTALAEAAPHLHDDVTVVVVRRQPA